MKARVVVNKIREKYVKWGKDNDDDEDVKLYIYYLIIYYIFI